MKKKKKNNNKTFPRVVISKSCHNKKKSGVSLENDLLHMKWGLTNIEGLFEAR